MQALLLILGDSMSESDCFLKKTFFKKIDSKKIELGNTNTKLGDKNPKLGDKNPKQHWIILKNRNS